jgi:small subunit ribosomal protein S4e
MIPKRERARINNMHTKRSKMLKTWPVERKGNKKRFVARANHSSKKAITILALMRDVLKLADSRKEVRRIVHQEDVMINGLIRKDETFPVNAFDTISLEKMKKYYRLDIINKKFSLVEIDKKEIGERIFKISGKKILGKDKIQMNLESGTNLIYNKEFNVGDSVIYSCKDKKVSKVVTLKKGCKVEIISGKHAGEKGEVKEIKALKRGKVFEIKLKDKVVILPYKTLLVVN